MAIDVAMVREYEGIKVDKNVTFTPKVEHRGLLIATWSDTPSAKDFD